MMKLFFETFSINIKFYLKKPVTYLFYFAFLDKTYLKDTYDLSNKM